MLISFEIIPTYRESTKGYYRFVDVVQMLCHLPMVYENLGMRNRGFFFEDARHGYIQYLRYTRLGFVFFFLCFFLLFLLTPDVLLIARKVRYYYSQYRACVLIFSFFPPI